MTVLHGRGTTVTGQFIADATTVDCQKQMKCWRLFRSLMELLIPCCGCTLVDEAGDGAASRYWSLDVGHRSNKAITTGTIFGYRRGRVSICIQQNPKATEPLLLLELAVPTRVLAKEMRTGLLRIDLECPVFNTKETGSLFSVPVWTMSFNGRRVGFAIRTNPTKADAGFLMCMRSISVGAGIIGRKVMPAKSTGSGHSHELMYFRANFKRESSPSSDSESFRLINPDGSASQDLSIFFYRSRRQSLVMQRDLP